ncbi:MAG: DUF488 domain-containing protein [Rhodocyclaceae bacterium]|nr:DUF488 domain-containing protein [Rhodocyclaceae bacterium]
MTIGFTQKSAERFFELLMKQGVTHLFDVRLNNSSQLSGFAKRDDLEFFLRRIGNIEYQELKDLAPTKDILSRYQKGSIDWDAYEELYKNEIARRSVERLLTPGMLEGGCLLCSEHKPHHCHRRVAVDYLNECWGQVLEIKHLF